MLEAAGFIAFTVRMRREVHAGVQFALSLLFNVVSEHMDYCYSHIRWVFPQQYMAHHTTECTNSL